MLNQNFRMATRGRFAPPRITPPVQYCNHLHIPAEASTRNLMDEKALLLMKKGAILINYSRGDVVALDALKKLIIAGHISGAAIDVFPDEPEKNGARFITVLQQTSNTILTPHIGGSTEEAQLNIGLDVKPPSCSITWNGA